MVVRPSICRPTLSNSLNTVVAEAVDVGFVEVVVIFATNFGGDGLVECIGIDGRSCDGGSGDATVVADALNRLGTRGFADYQKIKIARRKE